MSTLPPVVLIHGTRTSRTQWDLQLAPLRAAGREVFAPDLPGHGARQAEDFTAEAAVATIQEALARAAAGSDCGRAHLVGSSLGAMLAVRAASQWPVGPAPLASLVVAGGSVQPGPLTARLYGAMLRAADLAPRDRTGAPILMRRLLGEEGARACLAGGRAGAHVILPAMTAVTHMDLRAALQGIDAPVTILNGRYDQLRAQERSFAAAAPRGQLVVLPYGGHMVNLTAPSRFASDLLHVLEAAERRGA